MTEPAPPLAAAQRDLARAYAGGAPGVFVLGLVWLVAGAIWHLHGIFATFAALFIAAALILRRWRART